MFLLDARIFPWDLAISLLLTVSSCTLLASIVRLRRATGLRRPARVFLRLTGFLSVLAFATVAYGSFVEPQLLVTTEHAVSFPARAPLTVAVVSDIHTGPYKSAAFVERIVRRVNDVRPDLVLLVGDYLYRNATTTAALRPLAGLRPSLGTFAVLGNYDTGQVPDGVLSARTVADDLRALGITVLRDASTIVRTSSGPVAVAGIGDLQTERADVEQALRGIPDDTPLLLLSHNPDVILDPLSKRANLIVSGHTHGGQIRLPFLGPVPPLPTHLGRKYDQGLFSVDDDTTLAVTRGAGETTARARLFAWPEVMVLKTHAR
ncbi:MAG: metallophosphoesterase [Candidatus Peribacteraceae bacterium]|nr:metallophosphoesterase [Candidatus Peribacteraceae bacterium]